MLARLRNWLFRRAVAGRPFHRKPLLEMLEDRCTPATITTASVNLTAAEQLILQMINRARANPTAEAALNGIGLNDGLPAGTISSSSLPPLAPQSALQSVALQHSADMVANNYFSHTGLDGSTAQTRIAGAGYTGLFTGENIAYMSGPNNTPTEAAPQLENMLFKSSGHRTNILDANYNEVGVGIANKVLGPNDYQQVDVTQDFGGRFNVTYLTGVLYNDTSNTGFYAIGEGLSGVTVTATSLDNGQGYATTSNSAGGYEIALPAGHYSVTILGVTGQLTLGAVNAEVDYRTNTLLGVNPGSIVTSPPPPVSPPPPPVTTPANATQVGAFRNGTWILDTTHNEGYDPNDTIFYFGMPGDMPIVGDWNGKGKDEIGVYRNVSGIGQFVLDTNGDGMFDSGDDVFFFGVPTDKPVVGDWNGDGKSKVGVFRNVNGIGQFSLDTNGDRQFGAGDAVFYFGVATDKIVIGDWNGDGKSKVGVYRDNGVGVGIFSLDTAGHNQFDASSSVFLFGVPTDTVVIGDWNADGKDKVGVVRNNGAGLNIWSLDYDGTLQFDGFDRVFVFGLATDTPVVGKW